MLATEEQLDRAPPQAPPIDDCQEGHRAVWCGQYSRYRCIVCLKVSRNPILDKHCLSSWKDLGHSLVSTGPFLLCIKCGGYADQHPVKLKGVCRRIELGIEAKLLFECRNPRTEAYMEKPAPFREEDNHAVRLHLKRWHGIVGQLTHLEEEGQHHDY